MLRKSIIMALVISCFIIDGQIYSKGVTAYVYGDRVNVRGKPDIKGPITGLLLIGAPVTVIDKSDATYKGKNWYHVASGKLTGYIWGGAITYRAMHGDLDGDGKNEILLMNEEGEPGLASLRVARGGKLLAEAPFAPDYDEFTVSDIVLVTDKGFSPGLNLIAILHGNNGYPTYRSKSYYYFRDNSLRHGFNVCDQLMADGDQVNCAGMENTSAVIFPSDKGGRENRVQVKITSTCGKVVNHFEVLYLWNGKSFEVYD